MRIAFVGKGGSGKSTLSTIFGVFLNKISEKKILLFDADLNIHIPELVMGEKFFPEKYLSNKENKERVFSWLLHEDKRIKISEIKKTSTPTMSSNLINSENLEKSPLMDLSIKKEKMFVFAVGTYESESVGASCYHNNLAVLETILNFTDDKNLFIVVDMVAGIDAFAGTMHAQFDMTVLIVEPTKRSLEVYEQYLPLAKDAGVSDNLFVIGNKIQSKEDVEFIKNNILDGKLLGYFYNDEYLRTLDKTGEVLDFDKIYQKNKELILNIFEKFNSLPDGRSARLNKIRELHKKYVNQSYVIRAHGDLTEQIDENFKFI